MNFGYQNEPYTPENDYQHGERKWLYRIMNNKTGEYVPYYAPSGSVHYDFSSPEEARNSTRCFEKAKYAVVRFAAYLSIDGDNIDPPDQDELDAWRREQEIDKEVERLTAERFPETEGLTIEEATELSYRRAEFSLSQRLSMFFNQGIKQ